MTRGRSVALDTSDSLLLLSASRVDSIYPYWLICPFYSLATFDVDVMLSISSIRTSMIIDGTISPIRSCRGCRHVREIIWSRTLTHARARARLEYAPDIDPSKGIRFPIRDGVFFFRNDRKSIGRYYAYWRLHSHLRWNVQLLFTRVMLPFTAAVVIVSAGNWLLDRESITVLIAGRFQSAFDS